MNILVIGGTGFIGSRVTNILIEKGHDVAVVHRGTTKGAIEKEARHIHGSRDSLATLRAEFARFRPAVVLDVIAYTERHAQELTTVFRDLVERVVVLSSADVYRNYDGFRGHTTSAPDRVPLTENAPLREAMYPYRGQGVRFEWAHDYEKILVERAALSNSALPGTVLRLPAVYGEGDRQHRVGEYLHRMDDGQRILMTAEQAAWRWTRGYVENVAAAVALAVVDDRATGRIYNVGEKMALTEREWVEEIAKAINWTGEVAVTRQEDLPAHLQAPFDFRYALVTDTTRIRGELGYSEPVDRETALRRTIEWERRHAADPASSD